MTCLRPPRHHRGPSLSLGLSALLALALLHAGSGRAQAPMPEQPLQLKGSETLQERLDPRLAASLPVFISGERVSGRYGQETVVEGKAQLRRGATLIQADRLAFRQTEGVASALGNVRINLSGSVFEGSTLDINVRSFAGSMLQPRFELLHNHAQGQAERVDFIDDKRALIHNSTYSTCTREPGPSWMPEWILRASSIRIDTAANEGLAVGALLSFKGLPLLPIPALSFPLTERRKSGFLAPTLGFDSQSGLDLSVPYYWNIAPNRDATFFPTLMSRRGVDLGAEFRYLEENHQGTLRANLMPEDRLRGSRRWGALVRHDAVLQLPLAGIGQARSNINLNRVNDDTYWRDFPRASSSLTQRLLANDATLAWTEGSMTLNMRALKWQTLQDAASPITPPYDRVPQLTARHQGSDWRGFDISLVGDLTRFEADPALGLSPNAWRSYALAQVSRSWGAPGWFITPRMQLHATHYQFDSPLTNGAVSASRVTPTLSLDAGMVFERSTRFFDRSFRQTLEPRAFFVNTPFRDQSLLPSYDSAVNDFNLATIYHENAFGGNDRISDSHLLTLGVSSRLVDPDSGREVVNLGAAQRIRLRDQLVTLPGGAPVVDRISDLLLGASSNWDPAWSIDSTLQYNPKVGASERLTLGGRYSPGSHRTVSAAYRLQRTASEQLDLGWQWPVQWLGDPGADAGPAQAAITGRWYSVGRINFSLRERKPVESLLGLEYDAGCWIGRIVFERLQNSLSTDNKRMLFQLELVGFSRIGPNPLSRLRESIPRYQNLREQTTTPSRFSIYE